MTRAAIRTEADALPYVLALCDSSAGDDAAVLGDTVDGICVSTDSTIAGIHSPLAVPPHALGRRAAGRAISDLAAMGAAPYGMTCAVIVPNDGWDDAVLAVEGVAQRGREQGMPLVGGDLARADGAPLMLVVTVLGRRADTGDQGFVSRAGARAGDLVVVTGALGATAAAMAANATTLPEPPDRLAAGIALSPQVTSMIDLSDGLIRDAGSIASASNVAIELQLQDVPVVEDPHVSALDAVGFGDDYELLATIPRARLEAARRALSSIDSKVPLTVVGRIVDGEPVVHLLHGATPVAAPCGFVHR